MQSIIKRGVILIFNFKTTIYPFWTHWTTQFCTALQKFISL
jgi:hypothetical protein